jgi:hypothetical protein
MAKETPNDIDEFKGYWIDIGDEYPIGNPKKSVNNMKDAKIWSGETVFGSRGMGTNPCAEILLKGEDICSLPQPEIKQEDEMITVQQQYIIGTWTFSVPNKDLDLAEHVLNELNDKLFKLIAKHDGQVGAFAQGGEYPSILEDKFNKEKDALINAMSIINNISTPKPSED